MKTLFRKARIGISPIIATVVVIVVTLVASITIGAFVFGLFGSSTSGLSVSVFPEIYAPQRNIGVLNQQANFVVNVANNRASSVNGTIILSAAGQVAQTQPFTVASGSSKEYTLSTPLYTTGEWIFTVKAGDTLLHPYSFEVVQNTDAADFALTQNSTIQQQTCTASSGLSWLLLLPRQASTACISGGKTNALG